MQNISIHAPRVGRDDPFLYDALESNISIHAPRVGRDSASLKRSRTLRNFNPRAPCGARHTQALPRVGE